MTVDSSTMPIPFIITGNEYKMIHQNIDGMLEVELGTTFQLSCTTNNNMLLNYYVLNMFEVTVSCSHGNLLQLHGNNNYYPFDSFQCQNTPTAEIVETHDTCHNRKSVVMVGFHTQTGYLLMYYACFDKIKKNSLYTWYEPDIDCTLHAYYLNKYIENIHHIVFSNNIV